MNDIVESKQFIPALSMSEDELIGVLQSSLYPGAALNSIKMVIGYCKAAGLDPMQKPVHIVPMWDKNVKAMRDVIMQGIGLYRTQAARSNALAGISKPIFSEMVTLDLGGMSITVPDSCEVTVKRLMPNGEIAEYTAEEFWIENYATAGKDTVQPNAMWKKRPRGQLAKCAQAQALRMAFPEMIGSAPTAEEMEGKSIDVDEIDIAPRNQAMLERLISAATSAKTSAELAEVWKLGIKEVKESKDMSAYNTFKAAVEARGKAIKEQVPPAPVDDFVVAMDAAEPQYVVE